MRINGLLGALLLLSIPGVALSAATDYPVTLSNCGRTVSFEDAPGRVVTVGQSATEMLYALGLANRVKATSVWFTDVMAPYQDKNADIPRLADNDPSFESVVNVRPDLVAAQYERHVGPTGSVGTRDQFDDLGISSYVLPADCDTKDNTTGGDGTRTAPFTPASIYKSIRQLARIFDVQARGQQVIETLQAREHRAVSRAEALDLPDDLTAVFWFSSPDDGVAPYVAGERGAPAYMMRALGIQNVIDSNDEWPTVGWERIAHADPDIIVLAEMDRRRYPADDIARKKAFLHHDPVARRLRAVRRGHVVTLNAHAMSATMRTIGGLDTLSQALAGMTFTR